MSELDNKEEALAIIRGIISATTDIAKIASELAQDDDKIMVAPPVPASPPISAAPPPAAPAKTTMAEPTEKAVAPPKAEVRASSQAEVLNQLLNRKSGKA
ncbi:hypothetical protein CU669_20240 [Paramagnetospirillum kuznetsovii]|uniref:Uncharacterized protein n=1 Tax=Paramagnetospirillum kuznetsovii TaxID=2053833 RepID=A0A364NSM8_9PROT|nr:hypothetical protein [Paramagnetospirillum kuznetsovii]RAU20093.1 hypothetical protein CU669_20240 [Paramagnetospirillum kuznetsovii]